MLSQNSVGVIIARFQVPELHEGHTYLIDYVRARHQKVLVALGVHGGVRTPRNPLTFTEREYMVREYYPHPDVKIVPLRDHPHSNRLWSEQLDALIEESFPDMSAVLYGSRDSFIPLYTGHFPTHEVPQLSKINGTSVRSELSFPKSADARAAIIFAEQKRPAFTYATCDLAIRDPKTEMVLLTGKREHSGLLAFLGGHAEKSDGDARTTAMREQQEEVRGVTLSSPVYIGSEIIDDPRYKNSADSVMTTFFAADYEGGKPTPSDDVHSVRWVHPRDFAQVLVPWHQKLGSLYREYYEV